MEEFRKEDIKPGMVLELRNGKIGLVAKNYLYLEDWLLVSEGNFLTDSSRYSDDLRNTLSGKDWDIVAAYTTSAYNMIRLDKSKIDLIWKRGEEKEHTLDELYKMVGYKFKIKG
mgnify:FL=1